MRTVSRKHPDSARPSRDESGSRLVQCRILVTDADSVTGRIITGQLTARGLQVHGAHHAPPELPAERQHVLPRPDDPDFLPAVGRLVRDEAIDVVIPAGDTDLTILSAGQPALGDRTRVVVAGPRATVVATDRLLTAWSLRARGVAVPEFASPSEFGDADAALESMDGALVVRSRTNGGHESAQVRVPSDIDWAELGDDFIVQQYVPSTGYDVVVYRSPDGKSRMTAVLEQVPQNGTDQMTWVLAEQGAVEDVQRLAQAAVRAIGITGPAQVAVRRGEDGVPVVTGVRARLGSVSAHADQVMDAVLADYANAAPALHRPALPSRLNRPVAEARALR